MVTTRTRVIVFLMKRFNFGLARAGLPQLAARSRLTPLASPSSRQHSRLGAPTSSVLRTGQTGMVGQVQQRTCRRRKCSRRQQQTRQSTRWQLEHRKRTSPVVQSRRPFAQKGNIGSILQ